VICGRPPLLHGGVRAMTRSEMYSGTLIEDLLSTAERILSVAKYQSRDMARRILSKPGVAGDPDLQSKQFAQSLGLGTTDGNLGLLLVVHPKLVRTLEPGNDFADAVDIDEIRSVSAPE
jgi:hypothetical protein